MAADVDFERIYRALRLIRRAEEEIARIYPSDRIKSPVHLSIGQEFVALVNDGPVTILLDSRKLF